MVTEHDVAALINRVSAKRAKYRLAKNAAEMGGDGQSAMAFTSMISECDSDLAELAQVMKTIKAKEKAPA